jgi:multidrug efflux pump subunit AcrA (membrane-fusion protein)
MKRASLNRLAWLGVVLALVGPLTAQAGEGHDHGDAPAAPSANGPQRQPDGSVFLPKPAQRQLGVRTMVAAEAELPRSVELNGKVLMDPNAGGKVQPLNAGRIEPGPRGLPNPGQVVRKGEVLAYVVPSTAPIERSNQSAQLAELRAAKSLADKRVARLKELSDTVPRKDIEAAESEAASLAERMAAVGGGLATREALVAPVSGVIASAHVVAGQVVDARELLFEIVDPSRCASRRWPSIRPSRPMSAAPRWRSATSACRWSSWARPAACASKRCRWASGPRGGPEQPGRRPAGARVRADQAEGQGHRGPGCVADEEPGQPDCRLGQDRPRALRASQHHDRGRSTV